MATNKPSIRLRNGIWCLFDRHKEYIAGFTSYEFALRDLCNRLTRAAYFTKYDRNSKGRVK